MIDIYLTPVLVTLVIISSAVTIAYLIKLFTAKDFLPYSHENDFLKDAQNKANHIIIQAIKGAHSILVRAELSGIKQIAKEKIATRKMDDKYEKQLTALTSRLLSTLNENAKKQEQEHELYLAKLKSQLEERLAKFLNEEKSSFADISGEVKERIKAEIEEEMIKTKTVVEEYKKSRLKVIDENIRSIISETVLKVLGRKLSLDDQTELVIQALNEAKAENFLN